MNLYLIRHTEYDNPNHIYPFHLPLTLSDEGRERALKIGGWFKEQNIIELPIYASPIVRAFQTAEIIASQTNSHVYVDENITETISKLQGKPMPRGDDWHETYTPGIQESPESMLKRMKIAFNTRVKDGIDSIMVSHGDPLTLLYFYLLKRTPPLKLDQTADYLKKGEILHLVMNEKRVINFDSTYL